MSRFEIAFSGQLVAGARPEVVKANLADAVYGLDDIGRHLVEACQ